MNVLPIRGEVFTLSDDGEVECHSMIFNEKIKADEIPCHVDYALWRGYLLIMYSRDRADKFTRTQLLVLCLRSFTVEIVNFIYKKYNKRHLPWLAPGWRVATGTSTMLIWAPQFEKPMQKVVKFDLRDEKEFSTVSTVFGRQSIGSDTVASEAVNGNVADDDSDPDHSVPQSSTSSSTLDARLEEFVKGLSDQNNPTINDQYHLVHLNGTHKRTRPADEPDKGSPLTKKTL
uniref:CRAL-TRIO domain-containing protein n=1 Tax=Steinernema glaseri TaxID=37863 RepID=A0A1I7Z882_9BILA